MADEKKPELKVGDVVQMVAVELGFRGGVMVPRGTKFSHTVTADKHGKPRLPKWAQPADQPLPAPKKGANGDLKPKAAQDAVKGKAAALSNGQGQGGTESLA